jgi:tetratricopeptide (TPR) repeat protein
VAIAPATLHNLRYGEFVPVSANFGVNLLTGNSDEADGLSAIPVGVRWDGLQLAARQRGATTPGAFSDLMTRDALAWIAANPGRTLELLGRKVLLLLNAREGRNNINPRWLAEQEGVFVLARWWPGTWLVLPLAVAGLLLVPRGPQGRLLAWLVVVQAAAILPFFVAARFRAPLLPLAAPFAAAFVAVMWAWWRADRRRFAIGLAAGLALFVTANVDWLGLGQARWLAQDRYNLGIIHTRAFGGREPDQARAADFFRQALADDPDDVDVHERYGALLLMQARPDVDRSGALLKAGRRAEALQLGARAAPMLEEAAGHHARALALYPRSHRSAQNLGLCRLWQGELALLGIADQPTAADEPAALAALTAHAGAIEALRTAARIDPQWGEPRQALQDVRRRVEAVPPVTPAVEQRRAALVAASAR